MNAQKKRLMFFGVKDIKILKSNYAMSKRYYQIYKKFIQEINLPKDYIDKMYSSKSALHFYSESGIQGFKTKRCQVQTSDYFSEKR
jgi:hypothetical protein